MDGQRGQLFVRIGQVNKNKDEKVVRCIHFGRIKKHVLVERNVLHIGDVILPTFSPKRNKRFTVGLLLINSSVSF